MKQFAFMILAFAGLTSCLNENPRDQIPETEAYTSAKSLYINAVATLYNYIGGHADSEGLQGTYRGVYDYNTFTTDEAMLPTRGGDWYDGGFWQNLYLHRWTSADRSLYDTWSYLYKVIVLCNRSLARIGAQGIALRDAKGCLRGRSACRACHVLLLSDGHVRQRAARSFRGNAYRKHQAE